MQHVDRKPVEIRIMTRSRRRGKLGEMGLGGGEGRGKLRNSKVKLRWVGGMRGLP